MSFLAAILPAVSRVLPVVALLAGAHGATAQVVQTPQGAIEFVGLERWSVQMIRDSMAVHAPGEPLGRCAAMLLKLGFPAASVNDVSSLMGHPYTVVTLVEPARAARVRHRPTPHTARPPVAAWNDVTALFRADHNLFTLGLATYGQALEDSAAARALVAQFGSTRGASVSAVWEALRAYRSPDDLERALEVLEHDGSVENRVAAAAILSNFPGDDRSWWALMEAQRDRSAPVYLTASQTVRTLAVHRPRTVDWRPAAPAIRALLNGTNVSVLTATLEVLDRTGASPALGRVVLLDSGRLLVALVAAEHHHRPRHPARDLARGVLVKLTGEDFGYETHRWAGYLDRLQREDRGPDLPR